MKRFDKMAVGLILTLTVSIGMVILFGGQQGIRVSASLPEDGLIGPLQVITIKFSEDVEPRSVEALINIQPHIEGTTQWQDARTLQFIPSLPFQADTSYQLSIQSGKVTNSGREIKHTHTWDMQVRPPLIAYLNTKDQQSSIWAMDINGKPAHSLTDSSIKVNSFDVSRDGELIVFSTFNTQGGIDLWRVGRTGGDASILLDCGRDRCTTPSISPEGSRVAYSREAAGLGPDLPYGSPRVWLLDIKNRTNNLVYADEQILGYAPSWSPDGTRLVSSDGLTDEIRVLDIPTGKQFIYSSNTGGPVTWSPDSTRLLFTQVEDSENGLRTLVRIADLKFGTTSTLIGNVDEMDYAYYSVAWSPVEDSVLLGMRAAKDDPSTVFWLFNPGTLDGIIIADQPETSYTFPQWDVWGSSLLFQQFKLKGKYKPEIVLWQAGGGEPRIVAEGILARWLP